MHKRKYKILTLSEKEELIEYCKDHSYQEASKKYKVPTTTIVYWHARIRGSKPSDPHPLARRYLIRPETIAFAKELHRKYPNHTLQQLREEITKKCQSISITRLWHIIKGHY